MSAAASAADASKEDYDSYGAESLAQLVETGQSNCRAFGCTGVCNSGYSWTSRFTCVGSDYGYKGYSKLNRHTFTQVMGECTWDFFPYQITGNAGGATGCPWVLVNGQTYRAGSASGRCTFPGGDQCGEPLCSTLRVTIDGDVYVTAAYTTSTTGTPTGIQDTACQADLPWATLFPAACTAILPFARTVGPRIGNQTGGQGGGQGQEQPAAGIFDVSTANYGYDHGAANYYEATAIVISGSMTSISGQKHGCYVEGSVEYVPFVHVVDATTPVACPPGAVVVNPQDFTVGFTKNACSYSS